jgi:hypothetical protein
MTSERFSSSTDTVDDGGVILIDNRINRPLTIEFTGLEQPFSPRVRRLEDWGGSLVADRNCDETVAGDLGRLLVADLGQDWAAVAPVRFEEILHEYDDRSLHYGFQLRLVINCSRGSLLSMSILK